MTKTLHSHIHPRLLLSIKKALSLGLYKKWALFLLFDNNAFFRPSSKLNCALDDPELIGRDVVGFRDTKSFPVPGTYIGSKRDGIKMFGVLQVADGTHVDVKYVQAEPVLEPGHTLDTLPDEISHKLQSARANACGFFCMTKVEAASMLSEEKRVQESNLRDKMWSINDPVEVSAGGNTWHKATVADVTNGRTRCVCTGKSIPIMYPYIRQISDQQVFVQFMNGTGDLLTNSIPLSVDEDTTAQETLTLALNKVGASTAWAYISNGGQNLPFLQYKAGDVLRQIKWDLLDVSAKHLSNEVGIPVFTFVVAFQNIPQYTPHFSAGEIITILNPSTSATSGYAAKFNSGFGVLDQRKNIREYLQAMKRAAHIRATVFQIGKVIGDYVTFEIISESYLYASEGVLTVDLTGKSIDVSSNMSLKVGRKIVRHRRAAGHLKRSFKLFRHLLITRNNQIIILQAMYKLLIVVN